MKKIGIFLRNAVEMLRNRDMLVNTGINNPTKSGSLIRHPGDFLSQKNADALYFGGLAGDGLGNLSMRDFWHVVYTLTSLPFLYLSKQRGKAAIIKILNQKGGAA